MPVIKSLELDLINNFKKNCAVWTMSFSGSNIFSLQFGIQYGYLVYSMNHVTYYIKCLKKFSSFWIELGAAAVV